MTTATPEAPVINLNPDDATQRTLSDIYRLKAEYAYASDEYVAKRADGGRPYQLHLTWEALSFRFADNPDTNPLIQRSINVTDKNGAPATWGDPANPEPTKDDSFPIQMSKYFAKTGVKLAADPSVLNGLVFRAERRKIRGGAMEVETLIPMEYLGGVDYVYAGEVRIVKGKEQGTAGNPATGAGATVAGPTKDAAFAALASAMNGKKAGDIVNVALADATVNACGEVLALVAAGAPGIEELKKLGTFDATGVFQKAA